MFKPSDIDFSDLRDAAQESADELQEFLNEPTEEVSEVQRDQLQRLLDTYNGSINVINELIAEYGGVNDDTKTNGGGE